MTVRRHHVGRSLGDRVAASSWKPLERALHEIADAVVLDVADGGHDQIGRGVGLGEISAQPLLRQGLDGVLGSENGSAERMARPEVLREQLMDEVVRSVLDHLDLFKDHLLFPADILTAERRVHDDVGEDFDGKRQMLVQNLEVVARVLLGGKRVHLSANGINRLRDVFGAPGRCPLEQHVLDEMSDAALLLCFVAGTASEPYAYAHGADVWHPFGEEAKAIRENVADDC